MIIDATFRTAYWEMENDPDCTQSNHMFRSEISSITPRIVVVSLLILSTILDLLCWKWKKVAMIFLYLESLWAFLDTTLVIQSV